MKIRTVALLSGALATTLALAGCSMEGMDMGGGTSPSSSTSSESSSANNADITFAMQMVAHHEQAIEMAQMVLDKDGVDPRVTELAQNIKDAQGPEIDTMNGWLDSWGASGSMDGMDMGGTMSDADMAALKAASGSEANKLFLEQMTVHHEGAIDMAKTELQTGQNADALALAQKIVDDQTAEIARMKDLLDTL
ncbi:MAG: DUF305 domain-containing protein [Micrococcales bacterium 70-64]|jgi:uncharacterized protein (DUF305 family)|nr:DUF305 domain-containing protein [Leifsonia sp.]ODU63945.1 MAG: DUF305 domain-containing protein [Leifsonia sp. SCN 70-46]OJX85636.1 MAG: DUF305 domain-containing protein [Micrococcales bacterium 70-64]